MFRFSIWIIAVFGVSGGAGASEVTSEEIYDIFSTAQPGLQMGACEVKEVIRRSPRDCWGIRERLECRREGISQNTSVDILLHTPEGMNAISFYKEDQIFDLMKWRKTTDVQGYTIYRGGYSFYDPEAGCLLIFGCRPQEIKQEEEIVTYEGRLVGYRMYHYSRKNQYGIMQEFEQRLDCLP